MRADTPNVPSSDYNASPHTAETSLTAAEVNTLVETRGASLYKDRQNLRHFLRRVQLTMDQARDQLFSMHRAIETLRIDQSRVGAPSTLSPRDAARYLPFAEIAAISDERRGKLLREAEHNLHEAEKARRAATGELNRIRYSLSTVLESPAIPVEAKAAFQQLYAQFDELAQADAQLPRRGEGDAPSLDPDPPADDQPGSEARPPMSEAGPAADTNTGALDDLFA